MGSNGCCSAEDFRPGGNRGKLIAALQWQNSWGAKLGTWERKIAKGQRAPDRFYEQPEILPESTFYWAAFCDLSTERQIGMGIGPIPRSKAREYAAHSGIVDEDEFLRFWDIIRAVDAEQLKLLNAAKKEPKKPDAKDAKPVKGKKPKP